MKLRSFVQSKRGVSEIIASMVLVLIVSSAGIVAYSYSISAFSSSTSFFSLDMNSAEQQAQERFNVVAIWFNQPNQMNLTILNYGQIGLAIDAVYVNWTSVTNYSAGRRITFGNGALLQLSFSSPISIQSGSVYEIITVSTRGTQNAISWKA